MENLTRTVNERMNKLIASKKRFSDIFEIMFSRPEYILSEYTDGYKIIKKTYAQHEAEAKSVCAALLNEGKKGSYIAIAMENCPEWVSAFWGCLMSGHKVILVNMRLPESMTVRSLKTVGAQTVISKTPVSYAEKNLLIDDLLEEGKNKPCTPDWEDEIALFTSGTTLHEKVCVYSGKSIAEQILNSREVLRQNKEIKRRYKGAIKQLAFLPFYHIYGLTAVYMWFGFFARSFVFLSDMGADTITRTVKKHGVTHIFAVPLLWHTIENEILFEVSNKDEKTQKSFQKGLKLCRGLQNVFPRLGQLVSKRILGEVTRPLFGNSIKFCISGGSYIRPSALKLINSIGYPLYNGYGMTEIGITSVELRRTPKKRELSSIGKPFGSVSYALSEDGELKVNGSSIFKGMYLDGVYAPFNDEWFLTGDIAYTDEKGYYYLKGRRGDCVISPDGENLNPDEAEKLLNIEYARRFCVLGMGEKGSEELCLIIEPSVNLTGAHIKKMMYGLYNGIAALPPAYKIKKIYFADGAISSELDIKVSRAALKRKIASGELKLKDAAEYLKAADNKTDDELTDELTKRVIEIIARVVGKDASQIGKDDHFVFEIGGNSLQYLTLIDNLEKEFSVHIKTTEESYCATAAEFSRCISRQISGEGEK